MPSMIKIGGKDDEFDAFEKDMLGRLGLGDSDEEEDDGESIKNPFQAPMSSDLVANTKINLQDEDSEPLTPRSGKEPLLGWSHEEDVIVLDVTLPEGTRAKEIVCEVSKKGYVKVESKGEELLVGQLALPVDRTELSWVVDEDPDGTKFLCIELPMKGIDTSGRMTSIDCIFDETLRLRGEPCMVPGLSGVDGRAYSE